MTNTTLTCTACGGPVNYDHAKACPVCHDPLCIECAVLDANVGWTCGHKHEAERATKRAAERGEEITETIHTHPKTVRLRTAHNFAHAEFRTIEKCLDRLANILDNVQLDADSNSVKGAAYMLDAIRRLTECNFGTLIRAAASEEHTPAPTR